MPHLQRALHIKERADIRGPGRHFDLKIPKMSLDRAKLEEMTNPDSQGEVPSVV